MALHTATSPTGNAIIRSPKLANASVALLGTLDDPGAVAALARLRATVRNKAVVTGVASALARVAERAGTTPAALVEVAVADHGLDRSGRRTVAIGDHLATITVDSGTTPLRARLDPLPAAVRAQHAQAVAEARRAVREIDATLATERLRLEGLLAEGRTWPTDRWRERYLRHPLTGALARRLL